MQAQVNQVFVNEFLASNSISIADEYGEYDDWIELYNANDFPVNIGGWRVTDDPTFLTSWEIPNDVPMMTTIPANGFMVLWADNDTLPSQGPLHLGLKLSAAGEYIALIDPNDTVIDELSFGPQTNDISFGRYTDGSANFELFETLTPGAANVSNTNTTVTPINNLFINEFMAENTNSITDNMGEYEDWVEIYNANDFPINLAGLYITDDLAVNPTLWRIPTIYPDSTTIPANDYMVLWADRDQSQGIKHLNLRLGLKGEHLGIVQVIGADTTVIDSVLYSQQGANISYGCLPDATSNYVHFTSTTANGTNNLSESINFVQLKVFAEGAYNATTNLMDTVLKQNALLPLDQPFNTMPWNYTDLVAVPDTNDLPIEVVDWLLVEARDANDNYTIVEQRAAFLLMDGTVIDGSSITNGVAFFNLQADNTYFFSVKSRNHLAVLSQNSYAVPNSVPIDFTNATNVLDGNNQLVQVSTGLFAMITGDYNSDGVITVSDYNEYITESAQINQYLYGDFNLDGHVTVADFNLYQVNASSIGVAQIRY